MATNIESHECVIFVQSTKIGTHEYKAIHSNGAWMNRIHTDLDTFRQFRGRGVVFLWLAIL